MNKVYLSDAGPKVSPAIYGFWRWEAGKGDMEKIVNLCLELGVNTFDHADRYGDYSCEKRFGEVLAKQSFKRSDIVLFSKCGVNTTPHYRVNHVNTSAEHITFSVENSLRNLQTDYLDVFLLDQLDPLSDLEATALALEKLKSAGKVKNIGVSNFSVYQHQLLVSYLNIPVVSNHIDMNLLNTAALDNGAIDYIKQKYMRPLATSPLAGGRIENGTDELALKVRKKLLEVAARYDANIESIAVAWLVKLGALPLIGTLEEKRIRNIVNSFQINLSHEDWYELYQATKPVSSIQD
ncbi:aldo/keto reductase [Aquirufa regiilacus]|uniref:Aldo/keto reductase n=1 Tax=Aquirufa regiilacus TaxID=3024868 RepID=A0ABU3TS00_9BACT|nr:aldo/keto reductase [Aquirufa sp. LEOWEIH-7C]MDU0808643.1 aldo/keto reductase [Aquirufa sp. LEOWEIH-7C]